MQIKISFTSILNNLDLLYKETLWHLYTIIIRAGKINQLSKLEELREQGTLININV